MVSFRNTGSRLIRFRQYGALLFGLILLLPGAAIPSAQAQVQQDCGIVDALDYPMDGVSIEHDDFGMYRGIFNGYHTGMDFAFGRGGEPVRAAARGRVTFSDPEGWDTEKGVVVIEHLFPDGSTVFTLYGHMEELNGHRFPRVGDCVTRGQIIGAIGNPSQSARHLHYEIRRMRASTGGPGYSATDPLDSGWMHPIEFTERWRLRLNPAFRNVMTASGAPLAPALWLPDGGAVFFSNYQIEQQNVLSQSLWKLSVRGLVGVVRLPDGRILGRTDADQIILFQDGRFVASWQAGTALASPPMLLGSGVVFLTQDNRLISYDVAGTALWQTEPLGDYVERYVVSGERIALTGTHQGAHRLWVVDAAGQRAYEAAAPMPVVPFRAPDGSFLILVAGQVNILDGALNLRLLFDTGLPLSRSSQAALDNQGNVLIYPGYGGEVYAFAADGTRRWQTRLPSTPHTPPLLAAGQGCLAYVLMPDGALLAYRGENGALGGMAALYAGGERETQAARTLEVLPGEQVRFAAGYLSTATVDGPTLGGVDNCGG
ncbi:MAG: peptidoglycan DD-metalloendopeptidase family protein [Anaerolineae bacterium]|nr:peptidoglycan DD-metalloendopeptidase family protein [Anaerolineae bacterium]